MIFKNKTIKQGCICKEHLEVQSLSSKWHHHPQILVFPHPLYLDKILTILYGPVFIEYF